MNELLDVDRHLSLRFAALLFPGHDDLRLVFGLGLGAQAAVDDPLVGCGSAAEVPAVLAVVGIWPARRNETGSPVQLASEFGAGIWLVSVDGAVIVARLFVYGDGLRRDRVACHPAWRGRT